MSVAFNHTIVSTRDQDAGARFLADVLGLAAPTRFGPFSVVALPDGAALDYLDSDEVHPQHYAFLVSEAEFDAVTDRLRERGVPIYADPGHRRSGHNTHDGGRGAYFDSPEGHNLEVLTRPYGSGPA
ncbi:VOC family protein [Pseudonocardia oroxyli]|uniref:Glyoxalase/Bleomycin resistance protein/Dioxygenase superfamily protein n=1 Tax=Pseudonocardia oroxyli TaxID=366584 RepID=A0A1G7RKP1_PSEOR|nr:VOC family protein [Pseudonocardia oroxyli]SDG11312.1 Glyoxalase/Bleomycin resistance protein/Dioxygenase superfamily protein [Pseudonocardia oroxyli]